MTQRFELPIMYRNEDEGLWRSGRLPIRNYTNIKERFLYSACLCHRGIQNLFDVPDDAFMLQFVVTSKKVPDSYRVEINDRGWFCFAKEIEPFIYDSVINEFGLALRNHGHVVWYVSCFYWVVE